MRFSIAGSVAALILAVTGAPALAIVSIDLGTPAEHDWTVYYTFRESQEQATSMDILPYDFDIEMVSAEAEKGGQALKWLDINTGREAVPKYQVKFPEPVKPGERYRFSVEAKMKDEKSYFEDTEKLTFMYQTAHEVIVKLPTGYYPVYTDEPMQVRREQERVVLSSKGGSRRPIVVFAVKAK